MTIGIACHVSISGNTTSVTNDKIHMQHMHWYLCMHCTASFLVPCPAFHCLHYGKAGCGTRSDGKLGTGLGTRLFSAAFNPPMQVYSVCSCMCLGMNSYVVLSMHGLDPRKNPSLSPSNVHGGNPRTDPKPGGSATSYTFKVHDF